MNFNLLLIAHPDDECMFFTPTLSYITHVYCLSNGNNDGFGLVREKEFQMSCKTINAIGEIGTLKDGEQWNSNQILELVDIYVKSNNISNIYTFDNYGVSGHHNHISIYSALKSGKRKFYSLQSVSIFRKYIGFFDIFPTLLFRALFVTNNTLYLSNPMQAVTGYYSMLQHKSQLVWFRYLYLIFSRFMWINEFEFHGK